MDSDLAARKIAKISEIWHRYIKSLDYVIRKILEGDITELYQAFITIGNYLESQGSQRITYTRVVKIRANHPELHQRILKILKMQGVPLKVFMTLTGDKQREILGELFNEALAAD